MLARVFEFDGRTAWRVNRQNLPGVMCNPPHTVRRSPSLPSGGMESRTLWKSVTGHCWCQRVMRGG